MSHLDLQKFGDTEHALLFFVNGRKVRAVAGWYMDAVT